MAIGRAKKDMAESLFIVVIVIVVLTMAYRHFARRGRQMALLMSRGTEITGKVIDARRVRRSRTHTAFRVRYAFETTGGFRYEREIEVPPKEFDDYRKGQDIAIVYDPANPENNMLNSAVVAAREAANHRHAPG